MIADMKSHIADLERRIAEFERRIGVLLQERHLADAMWRDAEAENERLRAELADVREAYKEFRADVALTEAGWGSDDDKEQT